MNRYPETTGELASVGIHDGSNRYAFLVQYSGDVLRIFCPDYSPESVGDTLTYRVEVRDPTHPRIRIVDAFEFSRGDCLATVPFRFEDNFYREVFSREVSGLGFPLYVSITPQVTDSEGSLILSSDYVGGHGVIPRFSQIHSVLRFGEGINMTLEVGGVSLDDEGFCSYLEKNYGLSSYMVSHQISLAGENDVYCTYEGEKEDTYESISITFSALNKKVFVHNDQWSGDLRIIGTTTIYRQGDADEEDEETWAPAITLISNPIILTPERFALFIADSQIEIPDEMTIYQPRIINKSIQEIVNITTTSASDSKTGIIQPVFFRSRELASLVIHPEVDENICINLDAYKSQVDSFILKVEGVFFQETGRTNSGVVFKVRGNLLPASQDSGTAYILNEEGELITTGKYTYEY